MISKTKLTHQEITLLHGYVLKLQEYYLNRIMKDVSDFIACSNELEKLIAYQLIINQNKIMAEDFRSKVQEHLDVIKNDLIELVKEEKV